ncbi:MAG TPA: serine/threonine-protein kinase [Actinophytocola sp.]|uniref:serine/threonine-protein kinase n=1 Tax=Actinophytocola sp. TaxID=1872138 RepID=UPI002DDD4759|nr:serine/threonine-protein kinase [Actinophytocola sp.]HEV2780347.1 serine/threonine-protein kinase [Actinophytocola sp.]
MLTSGQLLADRYRLARRIAVGGMGEVWEAADTRLDRRVAVKVLKPELCGDAEFLHRFRTEARTTASLNHPGIAAVHDYGETAAVVDGPKDTAYLVMELVEGEPLAAILAREGRIAADRTLDILEQAGNALQAAHERGFVHRDVKPGNILIAPTGQVKLTDFGIAKAADAAPVTRSGMVMGTAHYIAPEQALGHEAEPASDVYSLAVVGYECLAGRRPFLSENAVTVAMMHIRDLPPPLPPDVPPHARAVIEATLVKDPRQRYGSGAEFAAAVAAVRAGHPLPAPSGLALAPAYHQAMGPPTGTHPRIVIGPPTTPPPGMPPGTGAFPLGPPPRPRRGRGWLWALLVLLLAGLILAAAFGIPALMDSGGGTDNQETPRPGTSVNAPPGDAEPGGTPSRKTGFPRDPDGNPGRVVDVDPARYVGRPATFAELELSNAGLNTLVLTATGEEPRQMDRCIVTDVTPSDQVPIGHDVTIRCREGGPPG